MLLRLQAPVASRNSSKNNQGGLVRVALAVNTLKWGSLFNASPVYGSSSCAWKAVSGKVLGGE